MKKFGFYCILFFWSLFSLILVQVPDTGAEKFFLEEPYKNLKINYPDLNFEIYKPPIELGDQFVSPTPPGEDTLEIPAPALEKEYNFIPWTPPVLGKLEKIPDLGSIVDKIVQPFDLLIITHEDFTDELAPLKTHKDYIDVKTQIYSWQELDENFQSQGRDVQERIKKAIASFKKSCNIKYVMLVGDSDRFPVRYCKTYDPYAWGNGYSPSDLYYADLFKSDGTSFEDWDGNGNGIFGEMQAGTWTPGSTLADINLDNVDLYPDVAVGRVPASTEAEVSTYVSKIKDYEFSAYKASWFNKGLLIVPGYQAEDGKYYDYPGSISAKETIDGYLESTGITSTKLYDSSLEQLKVLDSGLSDKDPTATNIISEINSGVGFVNFSGHGGPNNWTNLNSDHLNSLNNADKLPIAFVAACSTARFHYGQA